MSNQPSANSFVSNGQAQPAGNAHPTVITLVLGVLAYMTWAFVTQHQRVRQSVQPANIAINVYNLVLVTFTVILGLVITKTALVKLSAVGMPGAQSVLDVVDAA